MMQETILTLASRRALTANVQETVLTGDVSAFTSPGQFLNLRLDGLYLRRPISVCDLSASSVTIVFKVVGKGTAKLALLPVGTRLSVLTGLGNGYDTRKSGDRPLLLGGGVGVPPLYLLAKTLIAEGKRVRVILGFNTKDEVFYEQAFRALGADVQLVTADGTAGQRGFVTDALPEAGSYTHVYTCGPEPMLHAVWNAIPTGGSFSFEERMGCGFGACMGCSCETKYGAKRICRDGPVLEKEEIVW